MGLREEVVKANHKTQAVYVADLIGNNQGRFARLMEMFFSKDPVVAQRAAWVMSHCVEANKILAPSNR